MQAYRADRVVGLVTTLVSTAYLGLWIVTVVLLVAAPAGKVLAEGRNWIWEVKMPVTLPHADTTVRTSWGPAALVVTDARASLRLPVATLPWRLFAVLWLHVAILLALTLLSLHQLRRIFQRVRDGVPFDANNAIRLRWLGLLLLALAVFDAVAELATTLTMRTELLGSSVTVSSGLHVDGPLVFVALVVVVLAEIFRRGAELEHEQSLVV